MFRTYETTDSGIQFLGKRTKANKFMTLFRKVPGKKIAFHMTH